MKSVCEMLKEKPLGMDLTVPRVRTLPVMTIIHQKPVQGGINKSVTDRLFWYAAAIRAGLPCWSCAVTLAPNARSCRYYEKGFIDLLNLWSSEKYSFHRKKNFSTTRNLILGILHALDLWCINLTLNLFWNSVCFWDVMTSCWWCGACTFIAPIVLLHANRSFSSYAPRAV